jgi:hypothetical protein
VFGKVRQKVREEVDLSVKLLGVEGELSMLFSNASA